MFIKRRPQQFPISHPLQSDVFETELVLFLYLYQQLLLKESYFCFGSLGGKKCVNIRRKDKTQQGCLVPYLSALLRLEEFPELCWSRQAHPAACWQRAGGAAAPQQRNLEATKASDARPTPPELSYSNSSHRAPSAVLGMETFSF